MQKAMNILAVVLFLAFTLHLLTLLGVVRLSGGRMQEWAVTSVVIATWIYFAHDIWNKLFRK